MFLFGCRRVDISLQLCLYIIMSTIWIDAGRADLFEIERFRSAAVLGP